MSRQPLIKILILIAIAGIIVALSFPKAPRGALPSGRLITVGPDNRLNLYDFQTGQSSIILANNSTKAHISITRYHGKPVLIYDVQPISLSKNSALVHAKAIDLDTRKQISTLPRPPLIDDSPWRSLSPSGRWAFTDSIPEGSQLSSFARGRRTRFFPKSRSWSGIPLKYFSLRQPQWSPTGHRLAALLGLIGPGALLVILNSDGTPVNKDEGSFAVEGFDWSPDGKRLALFGSNDLNLPPNWLETTDADDTKRTPIDLPSGFTIIRDIKFSPRGDRLAAVLGNSQGEQLFTFHFPSKSWNDLTPISTTIKSPAWSPDAQFIAYLTSNQKRDGWREGEAHYVDLKTRTIESLPLTHACSELLWTNSSR